MLDTVTAEAQDNMDQAITALRKHLSSLRTGKATPALLDGIMVEAYGAKMPLNQVATLGAPEARLLTVQPFDATQISAIERAIQMSRLGITPSNDGAMIRLPIPALNEERRKDYVKMARGHGEDAKISIRNARRDANEAIKKFQKDGDVSEDDARRGTDAIQKLTDKYSGEVDTVLGAKEKDIMEV